MWALVGPVNRKKGGIKWGLVAHTVAVFSIVTILTAIVLNIKSTSYIDNRDFPGVDGLLPPGPLGYEYLIYSSTTNVIAVLMFLLNNWLADGLLVSSVSNSFVRVPNVGRPFSSIVATSFILVTTGSSPSRV